MVTIPQFCLETLVAACNSEHPDDLWLEYQTNIPSNTTAHQLTLIKSHFQQSIRDLLSFEEVGDE